MHNAQNSATESSTAEGHSSKEYNEVTDSTAVEGHSSKEYNEVGSNRSQEGCMQVTDGGTHEALRTRGASSDSTW